MEKENENTQKAQELIDGLQENLKLEFDAGFLEAFKGHEVYWVDENGIRHLSNYWVVYDPAGCTIEVKKE